MNNLTMKTAAAVLAFLAGVATWGTYTAFHAYLSEPVEVPPFESTSCPGRILEQPAPSECFPGLSISASQARYAASSFFPSGVFYREQREAFVVEWYSKHLAAMGEPRLLSQLDFVSPEESYRFLWLRSFDNPVSIRVWRTSEAHFINVKRMSGAGGYELGKLVVEHTREMSEEEWNIFLIKLKQACYWELAPTVDEMGYDGAHWILEGMRQGRYHVVDRWTPRGGEFREACLYLLEISGLGIDQSDPDFY